MKRPIPVLLCTLSLALSQVSPLEARSASSGPETTQEGAVNIGERILYKSAVLSDDVRLDIHVPRGYSEEETYPVLYLLDGEYFFGQMVSTVGFLSDTPYLSTSLIPQFIVVGITTTDRNKYFTPTVQSQRFPTSGSAELFFQFMDKELFAYIESNYSTDGKRLLTGWSLGGLFTTYSYLNHPDAFDYFLAVSPSLWWDDMLMTKRLKELVSKGTLAKKKYTITIGALEAGHMPQSIKESFLPVMSKSADAEFFDFVEIQGESHNLTPLLAFYEGLQSIFYRWSIPEDLLAKSKSAEMETRILELASQFGFKGNDLPSASSFLFDVAREQLNYEAAVTVAKFLTIQYAEEPFPQHMLGEFYYRLGDFEKAAEAIRATLKLEKAKPEPRPHKLAEYEATLKEVEAKLKEN